MATPPPSKGSLTPILVAEDDDNDFFFFERRIDRSAVRNPILRFSDGAEAVAYLQMICGLPAAERRATGAVLFLDIKMPRMNGFDVLKWTRAQKELDWLKVIMLSGSAEPVDVAHAERLGADRYLVKYPPKDVLTAAISAATLHRRQPN
jgi:DNA-binding NarL/FixJ family response regulator